jgi:alpha-galactosidase
MMRKLSPMKLNQPRIVIVGGGSVVWAPTLVRDMLLTPSLAGAHYVLLDIDRAAARRMHAALSHLARRLGVGATFEATTNQLAALRGADYVVITISTGGLDAMAHDLAIPEGFGIFHTVGDTSGPGGWARLIRNFAVFRQLARDIRKLAPRAVVLNYTNPMTTLTDLLARELPGPVVGLCHGLFENLALIKRLYNLESEDQISARYGGINHFFWITDLKAAGVDALTDLTRRVDRPGQSFSTLMREAYEDTAGHASRHREVATELFRLTGAMPYLGDRHTCEFFACYITSKRNLRKYKLVRTTIEQRRQSYARVRAQVEELARGTVADRYTKRSRETAADIIDAHLRGRPFVDVGDLPNRGQITNLPAGAVVETAVRVDANGFTPLVFGDLPPVARSFVEPYTHVFSAAVDACFAGDRRAALRALRMDPVCAHLTGDEVTNLGDHLLGAHRKFISLFP